MRAIVLRQIPYPHTATSITAYNLSLIRVYNHICYWGPVRITPLNRTTPSLPYLHATIFGARDHPFPLTVEGNASYIPGMTFESEEGIRIRGFDIVELNGVMTGGGKESLVRGYAKSIDL